AVDLNGPGHQLPDGRDHVFFLRDGEPLEVQVVGHRHVAATDALDRRVQVVERVVHDLHRDLAANAPALHRLVRHDDPLRLLDGSYDRLDVERHEGAWVDYLDLDALGRELLGRGERLVHHRVHADDGHVLAFALHVGDAERYQVLPLRHGTPRPVDRLVLEEDHRVVVAD